MNLVISKTKLFVGGLDWKLRGQDLRDAFSQYGEVVFARVVLDKDTRRSKGFGFVEFANEDDAAKAQADMNGKELSGRAIRVDFAQENPDRIQRREENAGESTEEAPE